MQFQADLLGVPVRRPVVAETTALGAAYLAGLAVGYWKDTADVARNWALDREFTPAMPAAERERLYRALEEGGRRARSTGRSGSEAAYDCPGGLAPKFRRRRHL